MTSKLQTTSKPADLIAARNDCACLFVLLQGWFEMAATVELDVSAIDGPIVADQLSDRRMIAALAMRKLQALHYVAGPDVLTAVDVVLSLLDGVLRPLLEAPTMYMQRRAELCDWDQELEALDNGLIWRDPNHTDQELQAFKTYTSRLLRVRHTVAAMAEEGCYLLQ